MAIKNNNIKVNEPKNKNAKSVYFFADHKRIENKNSSTDKKLKNNKPIKYSTVFMLNKEASLTVTDAEIDVKLDNSQVETLALKEADKAVENQKKSQTKWLNLVFFLLNIVVVIGILLYQINNIGVAPLEKLTTFKWIYILYAFLIFVLIMLIETFRTYILIYKVTKTHRPFLSYKASAIKRFYDCATPFTTGGQPFEVFYLNHRGINGGAATSVPVTKSLFHTSAFIIVSVIILFCGSHLFSENGTVVYAWGIISLIIAISIITIVILFSISKKIMPKIIMFFLKLLHKCKLVKDYNILFNKFMRTMFEYQKSMKFYVKSFWVFIVLLVSSGLIVVLKAVIPLMIYCAFNNAATITTVLEVFSKFIIIELATRYIPLPGGTGVAEISFSALFASLFTDGMLFWAMILYRIFNYFIYLLQGLIVIIYEFVYGNKKYKRKLTNIQ